MAIGSAPEIGVSFSGVPMDEDGFVDGEALSAWYRQWREVVGDDLLGGYATLHYAPRENESR